MKKSIYILFALVTMSFASQAQIMLADSAWSTTSNEQQILAEFNGNLLTETQNVDISYTKGKFKFKHKGQPNIILKAAYDKTELGVIHFASKEESVARITIHEETKLIVIEYVDHTFRSYKYDGEIQY